MGQIPCYIPLSRSCVLFRSLVCMNEISPISFIWKISCSISHKFALFSFIVSPFLHSIRECLIFIIVCFLQPLITIREHAHNIFQIGKFFGFDNTLFLCAGACPLSLSNTQYIGVVIAGNLFLIISADQLRTPFLRFGFAGFQYCLIWTVVSYDFRNIFSIDCVKLALALNDKSYKMRFERIRS